ncbi:MAG: hypothetical protein AAGF90_24590, partial [Pseudomonadota bacterium]
GLADATALYPTGTPLVPQYLTWGWWTGQFRFDETDPAEFQNARLQWGLGAWVVGDRTDVLPIGGVATYVGPATVNAADPSGADFVDGARFQLTWDFGDRVGTAEFQDLLDLPTFDMPVSESFALGSANDYGGVASVTAGGVPNSVQIGGSFFDGPTPNDALATAGSIRIDTPSGPRATGIFFAER